MTLPPDAKPDDWSDLSRAWTDASTGDGDRLDGDLIRKLRRRDRLARLNFAGEIGGAAVVAAIIGWTMIFRGLPWPHATAAFAFTGFAVALTVWSRRGDPGLLTGTPEAVLNSAISQARIGLRWAWAGVAISVAAMVFLVAMAVMTPEASGLMTPMLGVGAVLLAICIAFYLRHARACRRRMADHAAALTALDPSPTTEVDHP